MQAKFNVEGNRTATFAAKPPPAVAGPCWPTSKGASFGKLGPRCALDTREANHF